MILHHRIHLVDVVVVGLGLGVVAEPLGAVGILEGDALLPSAPSLRCPAWGIQQRACDRCARGGRTSAHARRGGAPGGTAGTRSPDGRAGQIASDEVLPLVEDTPRKVAFFLPFAVAGACLGVELLLACY